MADVLERLKAALADRYRIERELGSGGMATVYLAEDVRHERQVAIKVLRPELAASLGADRFLREIKITANLNHPHILPLLDSGEADSFLYYVMPYVEGESLRDRLDREKQLPINEALKIASEVADALGFAHEHNVIHRDIKPENILLEAKHAVVADFGVARAIVEAEQTQLTETGIAVGTPAYLSPEQSAGEREIDGRSDIYAVGCVLYEMLTGEPPFTGPTAENIVHKHLTAEPRPVTDGRPHVPGDVVATVAKSLEKAPADRYQTAEELEEALTAEQVAVSGQTAAARSRLPVRLLATVGGLAVVIAVVVGVLTRTPPTITHERAAIAVLPFQNLTTDESRAYFASGLHDELLTQLAKVASLRVISRTSVLGYAGTTKPLTQIADELGVGSIVEGSVQVEANRLRVNVQLIDAATDEHIWAERYDRTLDDAFAVQSEVAERIVVAVGATLTDAEASAIAAVPTDNAEAYRLYLQGEEYRRRPGWLHRDLEFAEQRYTRALEMDPEFPLAYASLAAVHGVMYWFGYDPYPSRSESQLHAAMAAVRLAPDLPQARWAMGLAHYQGKRDYAMALEEFNLAAEGLPGSAELLSWVAYAHRRLGDWDEALAALERIRLLDPRDAQVLYDLGGGTLSFLHRYEEANAVMGMALELAPDLARAEHRRARNYVNCCGELDSMRYLLERGPDDFGNLGTRTMWRLELALWDREPVVLLTRITSLTQAAIESQLGYTPVPLYAAWAHQLNEDTVAAEESFTDALVQLDSAVRELPTDWRVHAGRGLALAGLNLQAEARQEAAWLRESSAYADRYLRGLVAEARAMIFVQAGLVDKALAEIEPLLSGPSWTSANLFRIDPRYDPIREDPRFQALLEKYGN